MGTISITLADKDEIGTMFQDRNKIQNKPEDIAQSDQVNINQGKYEVLHLGLNIAICLNQLYGNFQFLV